MGKKRSLSTILFKSRETAKPSCSESSSLLSRPSSSSSWPWPSCKQPMTESFREAAIADAVYKTMNSSAALIFDCNESCFTHSSEEEEEERQQQGGSFSTTLSEGSDGDALLQEALLRGLRSERRLFSEPGGGTSSILPGAAAGGDEAFGDSAVALTLDSDDPYWDFRSSMEDMVAAHGRLRDWEGLEELLQWYLRANAEKTHGFIVAAFLDLLLSLVYTFIPTTTSSSSSSSSSPSSSNTSLEVKEIIDEKEVASIASS